MKTAQAVAAFRNSVGALLRVQRASEEMSLSFVGSCVCIAENRYFLMAHHLFNAGAPRVAADRFVVFVAPDNGPIAHHFPVVDVPFDDPGVDMAIVEVGEPATPDIVVPAVPLTAAPVPDGSHVLTIGFPAPAIESASVDPDGNWMGGRIFLKSHANDGIVAASYDVEGVLHYELNIGWHHGESGGPIIRLDDEAAAFCVMQHYRNISTPLGMVAGPHMGRALAAIEPALRAHGARLV